MLVGEWGLFILDVIGAGALGVGLIVAIWRGKARHHPEDDLATYGRSLRGRGWAGFKPRRPTSHSQQAETPRQMAEAVRLRLDPATSVKPAGPARVFLSHVNLILL